MNQITDNFSQKLDKRNTKLLKKFFARKLDSYHYMHSPNAIIYHFPLSRPCDKGKI